MKNAIQFVAAILGIMVLAVVVISLNCGPAIDAGDAVYQKAMEGKGCKPATSECSGTALRICNADHVWEVNVDCSDYETPRKCCVIGGKPNCYKPYECEEVQP